MKHKLGGRAGQSTENKCKNILEVSRTDRPKNQIWNTPSEQNLDFQATRKPQLKQLPQPAPQSH
jgi:hypothetical protein